MRILVCLVVWVAAFSAHAEKMMTMSFNNGDLVKMIEHYAKATGEKFILDPGVRGKATILGLDRFRLLRPTANSNLLSRSMAMPLVSRAQYFYCQNCPQYSARSRRSFNGASCW